MGPDADPAALAWSAADLVAMEAALDEARAALAADEVPIGAVVVIEGRIVGRGHNRTRRDRDPTAHAEMVALRAAAVAAGAARLDGATVYSTVEPCFMCAGALVHARAARVVWAVRDPKFGGCASLGSVLSDPRANHRAQLAEGLFAETARDLLQGFFRGIRAARRAGPPPLAEPWDPREGAAAAGAAD
jgi:tRNA(adenine34) deaminase